MSFLWKKATKLSKTIILEGDTSHLITLYSNYLIVPTPTETKIAQIAFAERERDFTECGEERACAF